jgi:hypothetical protein
MGPYSALAGKRVEVRYRAGNLHLSVCGVLVAESPEAIFLEDRFSRDGREKKIRVEIPYAYVLQLRECPENTDKTAVTPAQRGL